MNASAIRLFLTAVLMCGGARSETIPDASIPRPHVVVFLLDDAGWADFGCYGSAIQTPNIDALAAGGLRYRQFYNTGRCSPSRCSIMTGNYTHAVANDPTRPMPTLHTSNNITIAELLGTGGPLGANGYHTLKAGKWHIGSGTASRPRARGFDHAFGLGPYADDKGGTIAAGPTFGHWVEGNYYMVSLNNAIPARTYAPAQQFHCTDAIGDFAVDFIDYSLTQPGNRPLFAYLPFWAPHWPISGPATLANHYTDVGDPNPGDVDAVRYEAGWDVIRQQAYQRQLAMGVLKPGTLLSPKLRSEWTANIDTWDKPSGTQTQIVDWNTLDPTTRNDLARRAAVYAAAIEQIDQNVGKVVNRLKELGQFDNTLIFILSDNGANSEGGQFGNGSPATANAASTYSPWAAADLPAMGQSWAGYDALGIPYTKYPHPTCVGGAWANVSNTPWRMYKRNEHNGGNLTACVVSWPDGIADDVKGTWCDERAHIIDVMATVADLAGVTRPTTFKSHAVIPVHGVSLMPTFSGGKLPLRNLGFEHEKNRAFFQGNWKLVTKNFAFSDGSSPANQLELYDLQTDPTELTNRAASEPIILARMVDAWNAWALNVGMPATTAYLLPAFVPPQLDPAPLGSDLLMDTFNRANSNTLGVNVYYEGYQAAGASSICVTNNGLRLCVGGGTSESGLKSNFVGADITGAGGFSVQMRIEDLNAFLPDADCYAGVAVGLTQAQAAGGADFAAPGSFRRVAPCFVELDSLGHVKLWTNGVLLASVPTGKSRGTLLASVATTSFAAGGSATVTVFLDGQVETSRTFTWKNNHVNYIGLSARATAPVVSYVKLDNLAIRTWPLADSLASGYALNAGINSPANNPAADPDADGNNNRVEWLHGGQPDAKDASRKLLLVGRSPQGEFRFNQFELANAALQGASYDFECSSNLVHWTAFTPEVTGTQPDIPGYELVELRVPSAIADESSSLFIRAID